MIEIDSKKMRRSKRVVNILFGISLTIIGAFIAGLLYLESLSPAQLFINDTDTPVNAYLIGGTSPSVQLNVEPGNSQLVDMPSWWGTPSLPQRDDGKRIQPRWNLIVFTIFYLSDFPKDW